MSDKTNTREMSARAQMAQSMYQDVKMGADAIVTLLPRVNDHHLKSDMTAQLTGYEKFASQAQKILTEEGHEAQEKSRITRMSAQMGMMMNTALDATPSHIAEMMIQGSTMALTSVTKLQHQFQDHTSCDDTQKLAHGLAAFEQNNIDTMKHYL